MKVQMKVRDIIETLSPECTHKVRGEFSLVWGWGFFKDSFPLASKDSRNYTDTAVLREGRVRVAVLTCSERWG